jgi:hypothetical protein
MKSPVFKSLNDVREEVANIRDIIEGNSAVGKRNPLILLVLSRMDYLDQKIEVLYERLSSVKAGIDTILNNNL